MSFTSQPIFLTAMIPNGIWGSAGANVQHTLCTPDKAIVPQCKDPSKKVFEKTKS